MKYLLTKSDEFIDNHSNLGCTTKLSTMTIQEASLVAYVHYIDSLSLARHLRAFFLQIAPTTELGIIL